MDLTQVLATVGAISGVSALVWNVYEHQRTGPKLVVGAELRDGPLTGRPEGFQILVSNVGRTPAGIRHIRLYVRPRRGPWAIFTSQVVTLKYVGDDHRRPVKVGEPTIFTFVHSDGPFTFESFKRAVEPFGWRKHWVIPIVTTTNGRLCRGPWMRGEPLLSEGATD